MKGIKRNSLKLSIVCRKTGREAAARLKDRKVLLLSSRDVLGNQNCIYNLYLHLLSSGPGFRLRFYSLSSCVKWTRLFRQLSPD